MYVFIDWVDLCVQDEARENTGMWIKEVKLDTPNRPHCGKSRHIILGQNCPTLIYFEDY